MRILRSFFVLLAVAAISTALGYLLHGARYHRADLHQNGAMGLTAPPTTNGSDKNLPPTQKNSPLLVEFERDLQTTEGVARWLRWVETLEEAKATDFPRLFALARGNPELTQLVATKWAEKDARGFFRVLVGLSKSGGENLWEPSRILFSAWSNSDREGMIAAIDALSPGAEPSSWRVLAVRDIFKGNVEEGLALMARWHIENFTPFMDGVAEWAAQDPLHAAQYALKHPAGSVTSSAMETIGNVWGKTDPASAMKFTQGVKNPFTRNLAESAMAQWTQENRNGAAEWLGNADSQTRAQLSRKFVQTWAKDDLSGALDWANENLSGSALANAVSGAMQSAAEKDPAAAAEIVNSMQPSSARAEAAVSVARKWFPEAFSDKAPPLDAVKWISQLDAGSIKRVVPEVTWQWAEGDPKGIAAFLQTMSSDQIPSWVYSNVARSLVRTDPESAMDWSKSLASQYAVPVGLEAFAQWRNSQPQSASDWLSALPAEDSRRLPFFQDSIAAWAREPSKSEQLAQLAAANPGAAEQIINGLKLSEDRLAAALAIIRHH